MTKLSLLLAAILCLTISASSGLCQTAPQLPLFDVLRNKKILESEFGFDKEKIKQVEELVQRRDNGFELAAETENTTQFLKMFNKDLQLQLAVLFSKKELEKLKRISIHEKITQLGGRASTIALRNGILKLDESLQSEVKKVKKETDKKLDFHYSRSCQKIKGFNGRRREGNSTGSQGRSVRGDNETPWVPACIY